MVAPIKLIYILLFINFLLLSNASFINKPITGLRLENSSEDQGEGITDQQVSFIKSKIIEVAKIVGPNTQDNAQQLVPMLSSGIQGVWGVFIIASAKVDQCKLGLRVGYPLDDKWWQGNEFGPNSWTYIIWKQRN